MLRSAHRASTTTDSVNDQPVAFKKFPNVAIVDEVEFVSYAGHPSESKPFSGSSAKANQASCTVLDKAISVGVDGAGTPVSITKALSVLTLYVPKTIGISEV